MSRCVDLKAPCPLKPETRLYSTSVSYFVVDYRQLFSPCPVKNVEVTVFLVSLKAGGVALNLTEASRVYLMDSWWNPAVR